MNFFAVIERDRPIGVIYSPVALGAVPVHRRGITHDINGEAVDFAADAAFFSAEGYTDRIAGLVIREMPDPGVLTILCTGKGQLNCLLCRSGLPALAFPIQDGEVQHQSFRQSDLLMYLDRLYIAIRVLDRLSNQLRPIGHFAEHLHRDTAGL